MGSEHSSQHGPGSGAGRTNLQRGKSVPERESGSEGEGVRPGSISPGPSICSDSDLPYISYTVNRPIGGKNIFIYNVIHCCELKESCHNI